MKFDESKKIERSRKLISTKIAINPNKKSVAMIITDKVVYWIPMVWDSGAMFKTGGNGDQKLYVTSKGTETKTYIAKAHEGDQFDVDTGIMLVYCYRKFGSKTKFGRLCGANEPEEFAKAVVKHEFGSVKEFLDHIYNEVEIKNISEK